MLWQFVKEEFLKSKILCEQQKDEFFTICEKLENLKIVEKEKEEEYRIRQKQVTTYLECKKSFFGKIRYFFKGKKKTKEENNSYIPKKVERSKIKAEELVYDNKEYYTIEDLIDVTRVLDRTQSQIKNALLDIKALENSIERLDKRIKNAKSYIDEIEEHKKSIFEFWRFVNQEELMRIE